MALLSSILVAMLFGVGFFFLMRRNIVEVLFGVALLSHAGFIILISVGGWQPEAKPPILVGHVEHAEMPHATLEEIGKAPAHDDSVPHATTNSVQYTDPIPQALILTAIVIGFGVMSFLIVLVARGVEETRSLEMGELEDEEGKLWTSS